MKANVSGRSQSSGDRRKNWEGRGHRWRHRPARRRASALAVILSAGLSPLTSLNFAQSLPPGGRPSALEQPSAINQPVADSTLRVTLRIHNYAHLEPAVLAQAEDVATLIFRGAGVEVSSIDCSLYVAPHDKSPSCHEPMRRAEFAIRVIDRSWRQKSLAQFDGTGLALPCARDLVGCHAYIFYNPISQWAEDKDISASAILGHAIAHEVGHLLLGTESHSRTGIMRGLWTHVDLRTMARTPLEFTPEQGEQIRATLRGQLTPSCEAPGGQLTRAGTDRPVSTALEPDSEAQVTRQPSDPPLPTPLMRAVARPT